MENNGFIRAGSLEEPIRVNETFLKPAGPLEEPMKVNETFLKPAGDLKSVNQSTSFKFDEKKELLMTPEEIRKWLKTIISGKKMSNYTFGEEPQVISAGQIFVSIDELQEMVKKGDNIIKAEYFDNMNKVMIEFESFRNTSKNR